MNATIAFYASGFLAISQLLFMGISYLVYYHHRALGRLFALYSLCLIAYIILMMPSVQDGPLLLSQPFRGLAIATPAVLWLITRKLFQDEGTVHPATWLVIFGYIGLRLLGEAIYGDPIEPGSLSDWLFWYLPQSVMLGFAAHACYLALRDRGSDLVESRLRMRPLFVVTMGSMIIVIVGSGFFYFVDDAVRTVFFSIIFLATLFFNVRIFRLHEDFIDFIQTATRKDDEASDAPALNRSDALVRDRIMRAIEEENLYARPGLTIGELAASINMKEYLLRRFIHEKLRYRNFNKFINEIRVRKAVGMLRETDTKISVIALELGYSSPSSFNKVFRDVYGMTPTEFRRQNAEAVPTHPH